METATVSTKYQVVIPSAIRKRINVQPGQKMRVILYDNRIELIPIKPIEEAWGFLGCVSLLGKGRHRAHQLTDKVT